MEGASTLKFAALLPHLDERQRRLAMVRGRGCGPWRDQGRRQGSGGGAFTVSRGAAELEAGGEIAGAGAPTRRVTQSAHVHRPWACGRAAGTARARRARRSVLAAALDDQVHPQVGRGTDPTRAPGLGVDGGELVARQGFSVRGNTKQREGSAHIDRDAQFAYLNAKSGAWRTSTPVSR